MGKKIHFSYLVILWVVVSIVSPASLEAQRQMEVLGRGTVAVKVSDGVYISWRLLGPELYGVSFNIYRGTQKINPSPISGATNYLDQSGTESGRYHIRAIKDGIEQEPSDTVPVWPKFYHDIPVREIPGGYSLNDASVGDLDGDGKYEIVVKRISPDLTPEAEYFHLLEAYKLDGTHLWTIDYGPNQIGPQQVNFIVYDLDGDGKAEVITKTSEGTIDGTGVQIGDVDGDGKINYRSTALGDDIIHGPEFLSVYDGMTGREVFRRDYISRDPLSQWGLPGHSQTQLAHRADAVMMAVIYANGKTPTLVMCRGIYHRTKMVAMDYADGELAELWTFDSADYPDTYDGQGNHNLSVADVDNDGKDEIIYGSMVIDHDGTGLNTTGMGHGDALHVSDMDPDRPGLEVWQAMESSPNWGGTYRDAATAEILIQYIANRDMGRACAGDITPDYPGYEMWGATECPVYSCTGEEILPGPNGLPVNFMIYWDGDLLREFLDHNWLGDPLRVGIGTISKFNGSGAVNLLTANGTYSTNDTKGNPCLSADILGDWREEVIWRTTDDKYLRIYTTTIPTSHRIYTLMHDPQYRLAIAWQPNGYNQPPHPGFFLGDGMDSIPPPPLTQGKLIWNSGEIWDLNTSENWLDEGNPSVFTNGDDVLFGMHENSESVTVSGTVEPSSITVNSTADYNFSGSGMISGPSGLVKLGSGTLTIQNENNYTGQTSVWNGKIVMEGSLLNSHVRIKKFCTIEGSGMLGKGLTLEKGSNLLPGTYGQPDTLKISGILEAMGVVFHFDLSEDSTGLTQPNDVIIVEGDVSFSGMNDFNIVPSGGTVQYGSYTLIKYTGTFSGEVGNMRITGLPGIPYEIFDADNEIRVRFVETRPPARLTWMGGSSGTWDLVTSLNWDNNGTPDWFVSYDTVLFSDEGIDRNEINLSGSLVSGMTLVDASGNYIFKGNGRISGPGSLVKAGSGMLTIQNTNEYTGSTIINGGILQIPGLTNAGYPGPVGSSGANPENFVLNGGMLFLTASSSTNRNILLQEQGGTLNNPGTIELRMDGSFSGTGQLTKIGTGRLVLNSASTHSGGILLKGGTVFLGTEEACVSGAGTGPVTIESGTLQMLDNSGSYTNNCSWDLVIPSPRTGNLRLDSRCQLTGSLTGSGVLNLFTPYIRSELLGNWSAFSGKINVSTDSDGGWFIAGNPAGYPLASIHLGDRVTALYGPSQNVTLQIGELTGTALSRLGAGGQGANTITWKIGTTNTSSEFNGIICNDQFKNEGAIASLIKTGSGTLTLTNANTYSGQTIIEAGTLRIMNTSGSGTGSGSVMVMNGGTLEGNGIITGPLNIADQGVLNPGIEGSGNLTVNSDVHMMKAGFLVGRIDPVTLETARLKVNGEFSMNGYIYFTNTGSVALNPGNNFHVVDAEKISGRLSGILPSIPGEGLEWDTIYWRDYGVISIKKATQVISFPDDKKTLVYPNPVKDFLNLKIEDYGRTTRIEIENMKGQVVYMIEEHNFKPYGINVSELYPGIYFIKVYTDNMIFKQKFIKD